MVGISDKGNGYLFLIPKSNTLVEIDSKDAKFNETFAEIRDRKGKLVTASYIEPDLRNDTDKDNNDEKGSSGNDDDGIQISQHETDNSEDEDEGENEKQQHARSRRETSPRQFLLPGTHAKSKSKEISVRMQHYSNLCLDNIMDENKDATFILDCMEAQVNEDTKLMKELELLTACAFTEDNDDMLTPVIANNRGINLTIPDPKSQNEIDRMNPKDAARFNDATISEVNGMKGKKVFVQVTMNDLPQGTTIYQSVVNWTFKTNLGVYVKTKCRICFGGHRYDKSYTDTFAPTVNFCTVLVIICLSAMFGWSMG